MSALHLWTEDGGGVVTANPSDTVILTLTADDYLALTATLAAAGAPALAHYPSLRRAAMPRNVEDVLWSAATVGLEGVADDGGWDDAASSGPALDAVEALR